MTYTIEVTFGGGDAGDVNELHGSFIKRTRAEAYAEYLEIEFNQLPRDPNRWMTVSVVALPKLDDRAAKAIVEEARSFLEPDEEPINDSFSHGMYSIDHGGSGS